MKDGDTFRDSGQLDGLDFGDLHFPMPGAGPGMPAQPSHVPDVPPLPRADDLAAQAELSLSELIKAHFETLESYMVLVGDQEKLVGKFETLVKVLVTNVQEVQEVLALQQQTGKTFYDYVKSGLIFFCCSFIGGAAAFALCYLKFF